MGPGAAVGFAARGAYVGRDLERRDRTGAVDRHEPVRLLTQHRRRQGPRATRDRAAVRARSPARPRSRPRHRRLRQGRPSALWPAAGATAAFVSIPNGNIIYAVAGIVIFGAFTIFDFNRLRRSTPDAAVPIAAGIFLDDFNVFLLALELFGGRCD
jgi:hypothetical protein